MSAEDRLKYEISKCRNCEACRSHVNFSCLVFPEMFRLVDKERETGEKITTDELMHLINLCNFCGACPCLDIRAAIMEAKTEYMDKHGLSFKIRAIEDVERVGKWGGAIPQFTNFLFKTEITRGVLGKTVGIHGDCKIPDFPKESFQEWIKRRRKNIKSKADGRKKVAYFAGCTARYFFPDVAKAVIEVFERNGIEVYYPEQRCCGMPSLLEGDRKLTLEFARFNVDRLAEVVEEGYDIVCSCPTCGYMLKNVLKVGAYYSNEYLEQIESDDDFVLIPTTNVMLSMTGFSRVPKRYLGAVLKDKGYFSSLNPKKRIMVVENTYDMGEYLRMLHGRGELDTRLRSAPARVVYYPPCHLREQSIGKPYEYLLNLIPGLSVDSIDGNYCCGNGGIMGFKEEFHHSSIKIASRLIAKIKGMDPEVLATDCLSCRIQFNQITPYKVLHPIEIIKQSYSGRRSTD
jgi:glycerol-3-phosphate dehydrogenase subunit C